MKKKKVKKEKFSRANENECVTHSWGHTRRFSYIIVYYVFSYVTYVYIYIKKNENKA